MDERRDAVEGTTTERYHAHLPKLVEQVSSTSTRSASVHSRSHDATERLLQFVSEPFE